MLATALVLVACALGQGVRGKVTGLTPDDLADEQNMVLEKYTVETEDGYVLSLWRFNDAENPLFDAELAERPPILALHGVLDTGTFPMYNQRDNSMAYVFFDAGYDVWSLSARGTTYSLDHKSLSTDSDEYWDFTFTEIARFDLPAAIDFILKNKSNHKSVRLIGHSMGTTSITALMTSAKSWGFDTNKVAAVTLLAPAIYIKHCQSSVLGELLQKDEDELDKMVDRLFGAQDVLPHEGLITKFPILCHNSPDKCMEFLNWIAGTNPDPTSTDKNRLYVYFNFFPAGTSSLTLKHLIEVIKRDVFANYDYGREGNIEHYGTADYPLFDFNQYPKEVPLYVAYGGQDIIVMPEDVEHFLSDIGNVGLKDLQVQYLENYTHGDFVFNIYARENFINDVLSFFDEHSA